MTAFKGLSGGILAAGHGSRLRRDGWTTSKPLVPVAGVPLVEHAIEGFLAAGIERVAIIFNESEDDCVRFVQERYPRGKIEILVRSTASSFESFRELSARLPAGRALFATVDAWCPLDDFTRFVAEASATPAEATVLAVTPFVDDERPLWVRRAADGTVVEIGGAGGDAVTAGFYLLSEGARDRTAPTSLDRLRAYLAWLLEVGEPVRSVSIEQVVDVDCAHDVEIAETLAAASAASAGSARRIPVAEPAR